MTKFEDLIGKTIVEIQRSEGDEEIVFTITDDEKYIMHHHQDCCENVSIEDVCGDFKDIINSPVIAAYEKCNRDDDENADNKYNDESFTWTFYTIETANGTVTIRWYGNSNGYYSESVDFERIGR